MNPNEISWTITALASAFGMDRRTVVKRLEGINPIGKEGRSKLYSLPDAAFAFYGAGGSISGPAEKLDLQQESARLKKNQADKTELEVKVLRKTLIPSEEVAQAWNDQVAAARSKLVSLPSTAASRVVGLDLREVEVELRDLVYQSLNELQAYEPGGDIVDEKNSPTVGTTANADSKRVVRRKKDVVKRGKRGTRELAD